VRHPDAAAFADTLRRNRYWVHRGHAEEINRQAGELEGLVAILLLEAASEETRDDTTV
jgi:hypothetical protein